MIDIADVHVTSISERLDVFTQYPLLDGSRSYTVELTEFVCPLASQEPLQTDFSGVATGNVMFEVRRKNVGVPVTNINNTLVTPQDLTAAQINDFLPLDLFTNDMVQFSKNSQRPMRTTGDLAYHLQRFFNDIVKQYLTIPALVAGNLAEQQQIVIDEGGIRVAQEAIRIAQEAIRLAQEAIRVVQEPIEQAIIDAQQLTYDNQHAIFVVQEGIRVAQEDTRVQQEAIRVAQEALRVQYEATRVQEAGIVIVQQAIIDAPGSTPAEVAAAIIARDLAIVARDAALAARDIAILARDAALAARDIAAGLRDAAILLRDPALAARDIAAGLRDAAIVRRDAPIIARDNARIARDAAIIARDNATATEVAAQLMVNGPGGNDGLFHMANVAQIRSAIHGGGPNVPLDNNSSFCKVQLDPNGALRLWFDPIFTTHFFCNVTPYGQRILGIGQDNLLAFRTVAGNVVTGLLALTNGTLLIVAGSSEQTLELPGRYSLERYFDSRIRIEVESQMPIPPTSVWSTDNLQKLSHVIATFPVTMTSKSSVLCNSEGGVTDNIRSESNPLVGDIVWRKAEDKISERYLLSSSQFFHNIRLEIFAVRKNWEWDGNERIERFVFRRQKMVFSDGQNWSGKLRFRSVT